VAGGVWHGTAVPAGSGAPRLLPLRGAGWGEAGLEGAVGGA